MLMSVIIPVYNAEQWLPRCLNSVFRQPEADQLEVIVVDDGSTDGSGVLLTQYAAAHPSIRVIRQSNRGQAAARNAALEQAHGDWVLFLDADDCWADGYLTSVLPQLNEQTDVMQTGFTRVPLTGQSQIITSSNPYRFLSAWSKVVRRSFLEENHIRFPEGAYYDDPVWAAALWQAHPRITLSESTAYQYTENRKSVTANPHSTAEVRRALRDMGLRIWDFGWLRLRLTAHFIKERI